MFKAVGFDYGGVINTSKPIMPGIAEIVGMPMQELRDFYLQHNHLANAHDMSYEDLWTKVVTDLGYPDKVQEVLDHMHQQQTSELNQEMLDLVTSLRNNGYKTGLLSNNTKANGMKLREKGLDKYFDVFLISAEVELQKPDPAIFKLLFDALEVLPQEAIFVDDSESSLRRADEIGYHPILFRGFQQFRDELIALGIKLV